LKERRGKVPRLEPKQIQKELEAGRLWPVYWLYGEERMKTRELLNRIRRAALGDKPLEGLAGLAEENLNGQEVSCGQVVDAVQSLAFGGGIRLVVVHDAHLLKEAEGLSALFGAPAKSDSIAGVCVLLSKDLDGRKKFSKALLEKAAVVPCEEVSEDDREAWIAYLGNRRGLGLPADVILRLRSMEPWSLDIADQELEKYSIASDCGSEIAGEVVLGGLGAEKGTEAFFEAFFGRNLRKTLEMVAGFADQPDEALPLLGLLAWNVRQLSLVLSDRIHGTRQTKLSPFLVERFQRWSRHWTLQEALRLQKALASLDFGQKQTPRLPLGLWAELAMNFCRSS
jgi:DNA polymerase III delta subunit